MYSNLGLDVEIVPREGWGARPAKWVVGMRLPIEHVIIAHTVTPECHTKDTCSARMRNIQDFHMNLGMEWNFLCY